MPISSTLLKIVCVNFHIFQDGQGQGNFQPSENGRFRQIIDWVNARFAAPSHPSRVPKPKDQPRPHLKIITDSRIRFRIHRIEHYQIPSLHKLHIPSVPQNADQATKDAKLAEADDNRRKGRADRQAAAVARDPSLLKQLNIYVSGRTEDGGGYATLPSPQMSADSNIVFVGDYVPQSQKDWLGSDFGWSMLMGHELGHCLGLAHTYQGGGASPICNVQHPEYLSDVFGYGICPHGVAWDGSVPHCTNNLMGGTLDASWISPHQAATMHRALTEQSVRKYLATGCHDCGSCVAFTVWGDGHRSTGAPAKLGYSAVELNENWGWSGSDFVAPVAGVYHFDLSFRKEGAAEGIAVVIRKNGPGWIAQARPSQGQGYGDGAVSVNARLERGDKVSTMVEGGSGPRAIGGYRFSGHLICGCP